MGKLYGQGIRLAYIYIYIYITVKDVRPNHLHVPP